MPFTSNFILIIKQHYPIVLIYTILFAVFIVSSVQSDKLLNSKINDNQQLQIESRAISNDYRNITIDYLINLTRQINYLNTTVDNLEDQISSHVNTNATGL